MFTNMCGSTSKEHEWQVGRPMLATDTGSCLAEQHGHATTIPEPTQHFNHELSQSYNNVLYSHHYIPDSSNNVLQGSNNAWQYIPRHASNDLHMSRPVNRDDSPRSSPTTEMQIHNSSNIQKTYFESDITPYQETEQNTRPTAYATDGLQSTVLTDASIRLHQDSISDDVGDIAAPLLPLANCELSVNGKVWGQSHLITNTSPEKTTSVDLGSTLKSNLIRSGIPRTKRKAIEVSDSKTDLCGMAQYICQNNAQPKTVNKVLSEDECDKDNTFGESSSSCDSDDSSLSSAILKINCRDTITRKTSLGEEYTSGDDRSRISYDSIELQLAKFYQFECNKCMPFGSEKLTFRNHKLLTEHCREKHGSEGEIKCCGHSMWLKEELLEHMQEHKTLLRCVKCRKSFVSKTMWKKHMHQHLPKTADVGPYCCPHCDKKFSSKYGLTNHLNLHLPEEQRPFKCRHCNKGFGAKHAMSKHERTHLPDEERLSYVCDKCGKRFGYASTLDGHQKHVHQNERPFVCHICAKTFPIKGALTYHLTTHEVQDRVQCTDCGIWLKNEKILRIHKKCHQGDLYACPHCDKVSNTRNNLRMHMKRHSDARPHPCPLCARAFKTPRDLKTHMVQHTGQKPYSCPYCPKTFASPSNFYAHRKMKHKTAAPVYEEPPSTISNLQTY